MLHRILVGLALIAALPALATADDLLIPEPAAAADGLVESIGVATHWGFRNTIYGKQWERLQSLLGESGIRTVRDSWDPRLVDLHKAYGIRAILISDPNISWDQAVARWTEHRACIAAIEGSNEVNGGWAKMGYSYEGKVWPEGPRAFQEDLYRHVKDIQALNDIPVINLSLAYRGAGVNLAPLRSFDYINAHSYAGGQMPSLSLDYQDPYLLIGRGGTFAPMVATESGYHTCLGNSKVVAGNQQGISHEAHRKYIPRHVAEYFNGGMKWTVIYEFAAGRPNKTEDEDPEAAFGLLMPDGTPKPAYYALKSLIAQLGESKWDAGAGKWIRPPALVNRALAFALRGAPPSVHHTLLQRSDGSFQLLLWNEVPSFDLKRKTDIVNAPVPVTLVLQDLPESVVVSSLGADNALISQSQAAKEIELKVPDEVIIVTIKYAQSPPPRIDPPQQITVKTQPTSAELSWPVAAGVDAYWVSLNHRRLGPATIGDDGRAHFNVQRLLPATTYTFEVVAASRRGSVSDAATVSATTVDAFPDLVVRSLKVSPDSPKEGDELTFIAVVENRGNAPVDAGVILGAKFRVDGKTVSWNDKTTAGLSPGEQVEIRPSGGGANGKLTWTLARGTRHVSVMADDVNRIVESNEQNNTRHITVSTGAGPDLVVKGVKRLPAEPGKPAAFEVLVANQGTDDVSKDFTVSATLAIIDAAAPVPTGYSTSRAGIAAGGTLTLTVSLSADLPPGAYRIRAVVDDVDRVPELDEQNNAAEFDLDRPQP